MDLIDKFYIKLREEFPENKWIYLKDVTKGDMSLFVSKLYVCNKRKYLNIKNKDLYAEMTGKPDWYNMSFRIIDRANISSYYYKTLHYIPEFLKKDFRGEQTKLKL